MKTKKTKKEVNKFDLEKFNIAKLKNLRSINGGGTPPVDDDKTVTDALNDGNNKNG
ncbi:hypothetical protein [Flavobacterium sp. LHD-85]|uniref:hypothetical protein n=1 Tax=Flavobacterium sp. LHD-85 TaxID=3071410 RepID=UPI0027E08DF4|nr:hypothetical protein [Flavobacterium sp. LHD-85]MDQ6527692.1 hypothetical protein [Flavobacterium sp. LHD-85]